MAQIIRLRRSALSGATPTNAQLDLGELAMNTTDGKVYMAKSGSGGPSVEELIVTNTTNIGNITLDGNMYISGNTHISGYLDVDQHINVNDAIHFTSAPSGGTLSWSSASKTIELDMGNNVIQQIGEETYYPLVKNNTGAAIENGTPVMKIGSDGAYILITPAIADGSIEHDLYLGLVTETIPNGEIGRVTYFGKVNDVNTSGYTIGDLLYVSDTVTGGTTNVPPTSPSYRISIGSVLKVGTTDGQIIARYEHIPNAFEVNYNNSGSSLIASNVQSAIDELDLNKASVSLLSSNITLYSTTGSGDFGYYRLVTTTTDSDYPATAIDVPTGAITGTSQYIVGLIADNNLFTGNPGVFSVPTIGNIAKIGGNNTRYANFYFELYKRDSGGTETLIAISNNTQNVNPVDSSYYEFSASALFNNGSFLASDRIVIKYYGNDTGTVSGAEYQFQFGGSTPVKTLLNVPVSVIPSDDASTILVDTTNFNNKLGPTDDTVQKALDTLDDHTHVSVSYATNSTSASYSLASTSSSYSLTSTSASYAISSSYINVLQSTTSASRPFVFTTGVTAGNKVLYTDSGTECYINPSTNTIGATTFIGNLTGTASYASQALTASYSLTSTSASYALNATSASFPYLFNTTNNSNYPIVFVSSTTPGYKGFYTDDATTCYLNPSTNTIGATTFVGNLTGTASYATLASTASYAIIPSLTDNYLPYHFNDTTGLVDSPILTDGTNTTIEGNLDINGSVSASLGRIQNTYTTVTPGAYEVLNIIGTETQGNSSSLLRPLSVSATKNGANAHDSIYCGDFRAYQSGSGNSGFLFGVLGRTYIQQGSVLSQSAGIYAYAETTSPSDVPWIMGISSLVNVSGSGNITNARGIYNDISHNSNSTIATSYGQELKLQNKRGGTITDAVALYCGTQNVSGSIVTSQGIHSDLTNTVGTITTHYGIYVGNWTNTGTVNTSYALYIDSTVDTGTTSYAIYSESTSPSILNGDLTVTGSIITTEITGSLYGTASYAANTVRNDTDSYTGTEKITQIVTLSAVEYAAIGTKDANTLYIVI